MDFDIDTDIQRARDLINASEIQRLRNDIFEKQCHIDTTKRMMELDRMIAECCCDISRRPPLQELFVCEVDATGKIQAKDWPLYRHDCCDYDPYARDRRGRSINSQEKTEKPQIVLGENQIIRDGFLFQQYPYPDMMLELCIAYVGGEEKPKNTQCEYYQPCAVAEEKKVNPSWLEKLLIFLLNLVKRCP